MEKASQAFDEYKAKFGKEPPIPFGVDDDFYFDVLMKAIGEGKEIDPEFDWFPDLPDGAVI